MNATEATADIIIGNMLNKRDPRLPTKAVLLHDPTLANAVGSKLDFLLGGHIRIEDPEGITIYSFGRLQYSGGIIQ